MTHEEMRSWIEAELPEVRFLMSAHGRLRITVGVKEQGVLARGSDLFETIAKAKAKLERLRQQ